MSPFVSPWGGLACAGDIVRERRNPETGAVEVQGNGLQPLQLTIGKHCSYDPQAESYREQVWSGTPQPKKYGEPGGMNWLTTPVWRVVTNKFNEKEWERFFAYYIRSVDHAEKPNVDRVIWFQPDMVDVEIRDYDPIPLQLPLEKLDFIVNEKCLINNTMTIFEESLRHSQINRPDVKMMTKEQQKRFLKAFEHRKEQEVPKTKKVAAAI